MSVKSVISSVGVPGVRLAGDDVDLVGITVDSRAARPGYAWAALRGENAHGAQFAAQAIEQGVSAILTDADGERLIADLALRADAMPVVAVCEDPRRMAALWADVIHGHPSASLPVIGVTGTNGKTSVTTMVARTLAHLGRAAGVVGTNGTFVLGTGGSERLIPTERTTPEATDLHALLALMRDDGVSAAALEVSSHAMVLHRVEAVRFDQVAFTNLSQDHLDFHADMEDYFLAKASLFTPEYARRAVICVDDEWGRRLAALARVPVTTYATSDAHPADYTVSAIEAGDFSTTFDVRDPEGRAWRLTSPLPGRHYVANTLAVALLLQGLGVQRETIAPAIAAAGTVPGRMELIASPAGAAQSPRVVVDYSHTPDALDKTLTTLRELPGKGSLIAVIGAGGKRDAGKRPLMGEVASRLAQTVIVTDDNPRGEDAARIRAQVMAGATGGAHVSECADRADAIARAVVLADSDDIVLIAGKGAESGQDLGDRVIDFDDREHAAAALRSWVATRAERGRNEGDPHA
ncbi:MAG: UDP-N-acetylmuramoyl-L-alanyl-D-glutamate--2,6-diaminopimelate ligase [Dermabacter sp.]|nr:UDP-N-acetylmuramoyl-L-alanyl-D-glutamate--2,6-diaminopimelate ligase [Dermabacter sp.]